MLTDTQVMDLSPLQDMPRAELNLARTPVRDLTPLKGMPLRILSLTDFKEVTDVSAAGTTDTLETLTLPPGAKNIGFLRKFTKLRRIGYKFDANESGPDKTAEQFWADYDRTGAATEPATPH
jgi:hypothetical protein